MGELVDMFTGMVVSTQGRTVYETRVESAVVGDIADETSVSSQRADIETARRLATVFSNLRQCQTIEGA